MVLSSNEQLVLVKRKKEIWKSPFLIYLCPFLDGSQCADCPRVSKNYPAGWLWASDWLSLCLVSSLRKLGVQEPRPPSQGCCVGAEALGRQQVWGKWWKRDCGLRDHVDQPQQVRESNLLQPLLLWRQKRIWTWYGPSNGYMFILASVPLSPLEQPIILRPLDICNSWAFCLGCSAPIFPH